MARNRVIINYDDIGYRILIALYEVYVYEDSAWTDCERIISRLEGIPRNAISDSLKELTSSGKIDCAPYKGIPNVDRLPDSHRINMTLLGEYKINPNGSKLVNSLSEDEYNYYTGRTKGNDLLNSEKSWEPLVLDLESPVASQALEILGESIDAIEQHNEFSDKMPKERDTIVSALKRNYQALKEGLISAGEVREGLLKPLRYIAGLFASNSVGELAKKATAALLSWLGW